MAVTPLPESSRVKLLNRFIGDVRAWKADDTSETVILCVKDPARNADNQSFYAATKAQLQAGQLIYLGTTARGKDGGTQPITFNDGSVLALITEAPAPGDSGSLADLYAVTLTHRLVPTPAASTGTVDTTARNLIRSLAQSLTAALKPFTL